MQDRRYTSLHWFDPFGSVRFEDLCSLPTVDGDGLRLIFWDQEPVYKETIIPFMENFHEIFDGPVRIITSEKNNPFLDSICNTYKLDQDYYFFHGWAALDWYRGYNHSYLSIPFSKRTFQHKFISPNNIVGGNRSHRLFWLGQLVKRDLIKNNLVSFPKVCPYENQGIIDMANKIGINLGDINLPLVIDQVKNHAAESHRISFWEQAQKCFAHVVTETVYQSDHLHLTEKTFKPIVLRQPFLLIASKGSLAYLRDYGFQTFSTIWDESYDDLDDGQRISAVADICEKINQWTASEMADAVASVDSIVQTNHDWFYGGFQDLLWKELQHMVSQW